MLIDSLRIKRVLVRVVALAVAASAVAVVPQELVTPAAAAQDWTPVDFREWNIEGDPRASWVFADEGRRVSETRNQDGFSFIVSPESFGAVEMRGTIAVDRNGDDDVLGVVLGYQEPVESRTLDMVAFLWKQRGQLQDPEGQVLVRWVNPPLALAGIRPYYATNGEGVEVLASNLGVGTGWADRTEYEIYALYTPARVEIHIDGELVLEADGVFDPGSIGVVAASQQGARFSDFEYREIDLNPDANAGVDRSVLEGEVVTLQGSAAVSATIAGAVQWTTVASSGPPVQLLGQDTLSPSFYALDDGVYTFRLTATTGDVTDSDDVTITVNNAEPTVGVQAEPTADDGLVMVSATVSDPGVADTHDALVDWGDGTTSAVPAAVQGAGWATVSAAHVYETAGAYSITVTISDDDAGTASSSTQTLEVVAVGVPQPAPGVAIWADTTKKDGLKIAGNNHQISGVIHSNGDLKIVGELHTIVGITEYVDSFVLDSLGTTLDPAATQVAVADRPIQFDLADYAPGGVRALAAGSQFFNLTQTCTIDKKWKPNALIEPGLYWVPCDVDLKSSSFASGPITVVTEGQIGVSSGDRDFLAPFIDGLLFLSDSSKKAINLSSNDSSYAGLVVANDGEISVSGSDNVFECGLLGEIVSITGGGHQIDATRCGGAEDGGSLSDGVPVAAPPIVVPALALATTAPDVVSPGDAYAVDVTVTNTGASLVIPGLVALANGTPNTLAVTGVLYELEAFDPVSETWSVIASSTNPDTSVEGVGATTSGVVYPAADAVIGTTIESDAAAVWSVVAQVELTPSQLATILDPAQTAALRSRVTVSDDGPGYGVRQTTRFGGDILDAVTTAGADITDAIAQTLSGDGTPPLDTFALLAPGQTATVSQPLTASSIDARGEGETESDYVLRLQQASTVRQGAVTLASGVSSIGQVYAPTTSTSTGIVVPVLRLASVQPAALGADETVSWILTLSNTGSAPASNIVIDSEVFGAAMTVSGLPTEIAAGASADVTLSAVVPSTQLTPFLATASVTWSDAAGNVYGSLDDRTRVRVISPTVLQVFKDVDLDFDLNSNDVKYSISVTNTGISPVTGITVTDMIEDGLQIRTETAGVSLGTVVTATGTELVVDIGTLQPGQTSQLSFSVDPSGLAAGQTVVTNQAEVTSNELPPVPSDDIDVAGDADPTVYTFSSPPGGDGNPGGDGGVGDLDGPLAGDFVPVDGTEVTEPTELTATITPTDGRTIASWSSLLYRSGNDPANGVALGDGVGAPPAALGLIDPTTLSNGIWIIRITATDSEGSTRITETSIVIDGNLKLGRFSVTYQDMDVNVGGLPVRLLRSYDTLDRTVSGDFGYGWNLEIADFRAQRNRDPLGFGPWMGESCGGGFIFVDICYESTANRYVTITWPNGETESFDLLAKSNTFFPVAMVFSYRPRGNATSTLAPIGGDATGGFNTSTGHMVADGFGTGPVYNPTQWELTDRFGSKYLIHADDGLSKMTDRNGNTVTIDDSGVTSSLGPSITFARDADDRITTATGPDGGFVSYTYDAAGDLVGAEDQKGAQYGFGYDSSHYLTDIDDPGAGPNQVLTYDADGRLESITDAEGNTTQISVDPDARTEIVTSPDGLLTTISSFDVRGNALTVDEVYDGASHVSSFTYNDDDIVTSRIDPEGNEWVGGFDDDQNLTSFIDAEGNSSTFVYDSLGLPTKVTDPASNETLFTYDASGNVTKITDARGGEQLFTYDASGNQLTRTDQVGRVWEWSYSAESRVEASTDPRGNSTNYTHDAQGRLATTTAADGGVTSYGYDAEGNLVSLSDPLNRVSTYSYDGRNRLVSETDAAGFVTSYVYNENDRLVSRTDATNRTWTYGYEFDRMATETAPDGGQVSYTYDGAGRTASVSDPLGRVTSYGYDGAHRRTSVVSPVGDGGTATTLTGYDGNGRAVSVTNAESETSVYVYDALGRVVSRADGLDRATTFGFDAVGNRVSVTNPNNETSMSVFDLANQLVESVDAVGASTVYSYDLAGNMAGSTDPIGRTTGYSYDVRDRMVSVASPSGDSSTVVFDLAGQTLSSTSAGGVSSSYSYDARGLALTAVDALGNTVSTSYDNAGRRLTQTDGSGNETVFDYDPVGRLSSETDPLGGSVLFGYDLAGQRTSVTDANGESRGYVFDDGGRMVSAVDSSGRETTYGFDAVSRQVSMLDARGVQVDRVFDAAGQLVSEVSPNESRSFSYDLAGRLTGWSDASSSTSQVFDGVGRLSEVSAPAGTVGYSYNLASERTSMSQPEGTVSYGYDVNGFMDSLTDWRGDTVGFTNDADGRMTGVSRSNGVSTAQSFDGAGRLVGVTHSGPAGVIDSFTYSLDGNGNRVGVVSTAGSESYTLDDLNRLTNVSYPDGTSEVFGYDASSNRTSHTRTDGTTVSYTLGSTGQILSDSDAVSYTYDNAGNLTSTSDGDVYSWDDYGRLSAVTVDGVSQTYAYDAAGVRVEVDGVGQVWDRLGTPTLVSAGTDSYVHGQAGVVRSGGGWVLADGVGSVRNITDNAGSVVDSQAFTAFGETLSGTDVFGFAGEQTDATAMLHLRARQYQPSVGRFLSVDPVQPGAPSTAGWGLYSYAGSNPTTWTDPTGELATIEYVGVQTENEKKRKPVALIGLGIYAVLECAAELLSALQLGPEGRAERWSQHLPGLCTLLGDEFDPWPGPKPCEKGECVPEPCVGDDCDDDDDESYVTLYHYTSMAGLTGILEASGISGNPGRGPFDQAFGVFATDLPSGQAALAHWSELSRSLYNNPNRCRDSYVRFEVDSRDAIPINNAYPSLHGQQWLHYLLETQFAPIVVTGSGSLGWSCL